MSSQRLAKSKKRFRVICRTSLQSHRWWFYQWALEAESPELSDRPTQDSKIHGKTQARQTWT